MRCHNTPERARVRPTRSQQLSADHPVFDPMSPCFSDKCREFKPSEAWSLAEMCLKSSVKRSSSFYYAQFHHHQWGVKTFCFGLISGISAAYSRKSSHCQFKSSHPPLYFLANVWYCLLVWTDQTCMTTEKQRDVAMLHQPAFISFFKEQEMQLKYCDRDTSQSLSFNFCDKSINWTTCCSTEAPTLCFVTN